MLALEGFSLALQGDVGVTKMLEAFKCCEIILHPSSIIFFINDGINKPSIIHPFL